LTAIKLLGLELAAMVRFDGHRLEAEILLVPGKNGG
jgi:hypothetical protein